MSTWSNTRLVWPLWESRAPLMTSTPCEAHVRGDGAVIPDKARDKLFRAIRNNRRTNFRVADGNLEQQLLHKATCRRIQCRQGLYPPARRDDGRPQRFARGKHNDADGCVAAKTSNSDPSASNRRHRVQTQDQEEKQITTVGVRVAQILAHRAWVKKMYTYRLIVGALRIQPPRS